MKVPGESIVSNKIVGLEPRPARVTAGSPVRAVPGATTGPGQDPAAAAADASVKLTHASRNLTALADSLRDMPAVDELRVAAVKQRLQDGTYEIDPQRVADRMLRLESDLERASPLDRNPLK